MFVLYVLVKFVDCFKRVFFVRLGVTAVTFYAQRDSTLGRRRRRWAGVIGGGKRGGVEDVGV